MSTEVRTDLLPGALRRSVWRLPAILLGGFPVCAALVVVVVLSPSPGPLSALVAGGLLPVAAAPLVVVGNQVALDDEQPTRATLQAARRLVPRAARIGLLGSLGPSVALVAWHVWDRQGGWWLLPAGVAAGVGVVSVLLTATVLPLTERLPDTSYRRLYAVAVGLLARRPVPCLGCLVAAGTGVWVATAWSASVLPLLPGPVVVVLCAGVWTSALDLGLARRVGADCTPEPLEPAPVAS